MSVLTIASTWINAVLDGLERQGLSRTELTAHLDTSRDGRIGDSVRLEISQGRRIWLRAAQLSDDPLLGIRVGAHLPLRAASVVSVVRAHSLTFGASLRHLLRYQTLLSESGRFTADRHGLGVTLTYRPQAAAVAVHPLQIDSVVASALRGGPRPQRVWLTDRRERDPTPFAEALRCPVTLGAGRARIEYPVAALAMTQNGADAALRDINLAYAESLLTAQRRMDALCQSVRAAIVRLGPGRAGLEAVAAELGYAPRTLQRRLADAGVGFRTLFESARMEEALLLLGESDAAIEHIARLLGYSEASAFSRAVSRWWGASPRRLRRDGGGPGMASQSASNTSEAEFRQ